MFKIKDLLAILFLEMLFLQPALLVQATNVYTGAYGSNGSNLYSTSKVIMGMDFSGTTPNTIPSGTSVMGVLSATGGSGTTPSSYMYQAPVVCLPNGTLRFFPQVWQGPTEWQLANLYVGTYTHYIIFAKMQWDGTTVVRV